MQLTKSLTLLAFISNVCFAQVVYLEKDKPAPYTGYLFTLDKEREVAANTLELKYFKDLNLIQENILNQYKTNVNDLFESNQNYKKELLKSYETIASNENSSFWKALVYFGAGVVSAIAISYGVRK